MHLPKIHLHVPCIYFLLCYTGIIAAQPLLTPSANSLDELSSLGLISSDQPICLHLGCGQKYLPGYINIDFAPDQHTIQIDSVADCFGDITQLQFSTESISHIRLHHLFEHFTRAQALALLCQWHQWLKIDGLLTIETPDFITCCQKLLTKNFIEQQKIIRHIFGSQEAPWAIHYDGWYTEKFEKTLTTLGFEITALTKNSWHGTYNICVTARKKEQLSNEQLKKTASKLLRDYMVDKSGSEEKLWQEWCVNFARGF